MLTDKIIIVPNLNGNVIKEEMKKWLNSEPRDKKLG